MVKKTNTGGNTNSTNKLSAEKPTVDSGVEEQLTVTVDSTINPNDPSQGKGFAIRINKVREGSFTATEHADIPVHCRTVFIDMLAGTVQYEELFRKEGTNINHLIRRFKEDDDLQSTLSTFFRSMKMRDVIVHLIKSTMTRPEDVEFSINDYIETLSVKGGLKPDQSVLVADMTYAPLTRAGFRIAVSERYFVRCENARMVVSIQDLKKDVGAQACANIMDRVNINDLGKNRHAREVLGEEIALAFRPVGSALLSKAVYGKAIDDIIVGIRAKNDVANDVYRCVVPEWLMEHSVIDELSQNLTFLTAAFTLDGTASPHLSVDKDDLRKYLDVLSASLKASTRYRSVTIKSMLEEYDLQHGIDYNDELAFATLTHHVSYERAAMCATPTYSGKDIIYLDQPGDSRVAEYLVALDTGMFSIGEASSAMYRSLNSMVGDERKWSNTSSPLLVVTDTQAEHISPEMLVALAYSRSVAIRPVDVTSTTRDYISEDDVGGIKVPNFVFTVDIDRTRRLPYKIRDQMFDSTYMVTSDPTMVTLLSKSFDAKRSRPVPAQLPSEKIFGARLLNVNETIAQKLNTGVKYDIEVGQTKVAGEFYLKSMDTFTSSSAQAVLINPLNKSVVTTIARTLDLVAIKDPDARRELWFNSHLYEYIIKNLARRVSRSFRETVGKKIAQAALKGNGKGLTNEQSVAMRSALNRDQFKAQVDIFALKVYLVAIGCIEASEIIDKLLSTESGRMHVFMLGADKDESHNK